MRISLSLALLASIAASAQIPSAFPANPALPGQQAQVQMLQSQFMMRGQMMLAGQAAMLQARSFGMNSGMLSNEISILRMQGMSQATQQHAMLAITFQLRANNQAAMLRTVMANRANLLPAAAGMQPALGQAAGPIIMRPTFGNQMVVAKPSISQHSAKVKPGTLITLSTETHYCTLYYSTDGWTPTTESRRYTGPIAINHTTHLRVMAQGPNFMRSSVAEADYTVEGDKPEAVEPLVVPAEGTLRQGTPLRLVTSAEVTSEKAKVGDTMPLILDQDIKQGDTVIAPKGTPVQARITIADPRGASDVPGDLVFEVDSLDLHGQKIPLYATETMEGKGGVMLGSTDAVIKPGMSVTALVLTDTAVKP